MPRTRKARKTRKKAARKRTVAASRGATSTVSAAKKRKARPKGKRAAPGKRQKERRGPTPSVSPLAPKSFPTMPAVEGVALTGLEAGIRYAGRRDVMFAVFEPGTKVAGVFTNSKTAAAPVEWCRSSLSNGSARGLVVNSGNANAFTGVAGQAATKETAAAAAGLIGCRQNDVFVCSTGVIGERLPVETLTGALPGAYEALSPYAWHDAAEAIRTTDTYPKGASEVARIDGEPVVINGIAKGSGMIAPNMATMLAFLFTDAAIPTDVLQTCLLLEVRETFNAITVDSDTSTSDTILLFATGKGRPHGDIKRAGDARLREFRSKLGLVMRNLAHQVVRDGEGATKFIEIKVTGAATAKAAHNVAMSVANSPLVKTAVAGEDPNWGRVVMAVGKAGETVIPDKLAIVMGGHVVARGGEVDPDYNEEHVARHMKGSEITIEVDLGAGTGTATVWTCDLTHGYIDINADYRS